MFNIGLPELIVILLIVFILFGAKKMPEIAKSVAQAIRIFKKEIADAGLQDTEKQDKE